MLDKNKQLLCGTDNKLIVYDVYTHMTAGTFINRDACMPMKGHRDIVRCIAQGEHRAFSAGFDRRLVVYDINGAIDHKMVVLSVVREAHCGIISCLTTARNTDGQFLLISGSFDRLIKIWNEDGQLLNVIRGFNHTVLSVTHRGYLLAWRNNPNSSLATFRIGSGIQAVATSE
ncbi:unnamed protein product [Echinostoma caproni]|uniref:WD_REPEATS_REGION domain-containing protein n=1 Tax=Echinostoma caproni TaxID=27848 RepID=A0A183ATX5_9TREM|nr:unnamed protein product [Echinostoma caproni]